MSEKSFKNVMLRLPNDEYVKLKALAEHQRTSMNAAALAAINVAVEGALETGLYLDESLLKSHARRPASWLAQIANDESFITSSGLFKEAGTSRMEHQIEHARIVIRDWMKWHARVRVALLQQGLSIESVESALASLLDSHSEIFLTNEPEVNHRQFAEIRGLPALRRASNNCMEQSRKLMSLLHGTEVARQTLDVAVNLIDKVKKEG